MLLLPCLFKVRPLVLSKTLSQMWYRFKFTYVIVKYGIVNPNVNGFLDVSSYVVPLPPYYLEVVMVSGVACFGCCDDEWQRGPSGALCIFHQRSWRFPLCIHHHMLGHHIGTSRWHHFS